MWITLFSFEVKLRVMLGHEKYHCQDRHCFICDADMNFSNGLSHSAVEQQFMHRLSKFIHHISDVEYLLSRGKTGKGKLSISLELLGHISVLFWFIIGFLI
jgi:hypothetical protein